MKTRYKLLLVVAVIVISIVGYKGNYGEYTLVYYRNIVDYNSELIV